MSTALFYNNMTFTENTIISGNIVRTKSPINAELAYDTFDVTILNTDYPLVDFTSFVRGTPCQLARDNELIGEFYINGVDRVEANQYELHFVSAMGLLDTITHKGGVYTGGTAGSIINEILQGTLVTDQGTYEEYDGIVDYVLEKRVKNTPLNGWLPYSISARTNLQQVLFALGASVTKTATGKLQISYWQPTSATVIPDDRLYLEGKSIEYRSRPTSISITEHEYRQTDYDVEEELYNGSSPVTNKLVVFTEPHYGYVADTGLTIDDSGANYVIVSGSGKLTGKKYTHNTNVIVKETDVSGEENTYSVTDATLVSALNSNNVAERVASYYVDAQVVNYGMLVEGDIVEGDRIQFTNPYGETVSGYISQEDINISSVLKATTKIVTNWQPNHIGNTFDNYVILDAVGEKFRPTASQVGTQARIILFGGFQGGQGGGGSTDGTGGATYEIPWWSEYTLPDGTDGTAGTAGAGGTGVMMYQVDITLANRDYTLTAVGAGGAGGAGGGKGQDGSLGSLGGNTICAGYSSANGSLLNTGFANPLTGEVYGTSKAGFRGGNVGETIYYNGRAYASGSTGAYHSYGGYPSAGDWGNSQGGHGSGAYAFSAGSNGGDGSTQAPHGGNGANAVTPNPPSDAQFGCCGDGGYGSNAPGGGGGCYESSTNSKTSPMIQGSGGTGASGSRGGNGSQGFALILYNTGT